MAAPAGTPRFVDSDDVPISLDVLKGVVPKNRRHIITQSLVDEVNLLVQEPEARKVFRDNLIGYTSVLSDSNINLATYVNAVTYISYKMMGDTNQQAWMKTFPERYQRLIRDRKITKGDDMFLRSTVACYNRNKVVKQVEEMAIIPTWLLNQDTYQKAINVQANLMVTAKSEMVRTQAANSLLQHLKQPEANKLTLDINVKEDDSIRELREATKLLAQRQRELIQDGTMNAKDVAESRILPGEYKRVK